MRLAYLTLDQYVFAHLRFNIVQRNGYLLTLNTNNVQWELDFAQMRIMRLRGNSS